MNVEKYKLPAGDLASRKLGISLRNTIEDYFYADTVLIDCGDVQSISESYADEVFGVLVVKYGFDSVIKRIKLVDAKESILKNIASVINRRKNEINNLIEAV